MNQNHTTRKKAKHLLAVLLAFVLLFGVAFPTGLAGMQVYAEESISEQESSAADESGMQVNAEESISEQESSAADETSMAAEPSRNSAEMYKRPGGGGGQGGQGGGDSGNELNPGSYNSRASVNWDTMTPTTQNGKITGGSVAVGNRSKITSVTLNGTAVQQANSNDSSQWKKSTTLKTYFPNASASSSTSTMQSGKLVITPASGYYVTAVVIGCCGPQGGVNPFACETWKAGNAFTASFSVGTSGAVTVDVSSLDFSHRSQSTQYFILIAVASVPTPLYVEYDYGSIATPETDDGTVFADPSKWTATSANGNDYGTGLVETNYTQYKYAYENDSAEVTSWKHYANTITAAAKQAAAEKGYAFDGWKVEYYSTCTTTNSSDAYGNNKTYTFSNSYGDGTAGENDAVSLTTNARLIAQWKPIELTVTKTVEGLAGNSSFSSTEKTYTIAVEKQNGDTWELYKTVTLTVTGDGTAFEKLTTVPAGTYRAVENEEGLDITVGATTMYASVDNGDEAVLSANNISATLAVTNTYTETQDEQTDDPYILVRKTFVGITDGSLIPANFSITVGDYLLTKAGDTATKTPAAVQSTDNGGNIVWTWTLNNVPSGTYKVEEANYEIDNFTVTTSGTGTSVTTKPATLNIVETGREPSCKATEYTIGQVDYIYAKLTANTGYFLWTKETLSANQRTAFATKIGVAEDKIFFYSGDKLTDADGMVFRGNNIKYDQANGKVIFTEPRQWAQFWYGTYLANSPVSPEIEVTNTYTPSLTTITVAKDVEGNFYSTSETFSFNATLAKNGESVEFPAQTDVNVTLSQDQKTATFSLSEKGGAITLNVPIGVDLTVTETDTKNADSVTAKQGEAGLTVTGNAVTVTTEQTNSGITIINTKNMSINTGISMDVLPYVFLLAAAVIGAGAYVIIRKRRRQND